MEMVSCSPNDDGGDDGSLLSFEDPNDMLDDDGDCIWRWSVAALDGAHDDVALGDGGAPWSS